jgi:hypothetical protein
MQLQSGDVIEGYRLEALLGRGAVASVFAASFEGRPVSPWQRRPDLALKVWDPSDRAAREPTKALGARRLYFPTGGRPWCEPIKAEDVPEILYSEYAFLFQHPGRLMPQALYFGMGRQLGRAPAYFYVMERLEGRTLREWLNEEQGQERLRWLRPLRAMVTELAVLQAQDAAFFHGDIKPENIIVEDGEQRFRLIDPAGREPWWPTTTPAYNPMYAPDGVLVDAAAIATLVIEIHAGAPPFAALEGSERRSSSSFAERLGLARLAGLVPKVVLDVAVDWLRPSWSYSTLASDWDHRLGGTP